MSHLDPETTRRKISVPKQFAYLTSLCLFLLVGCPSTSTVTQDGPDDVADTGGTGDDVSDDVTDTGGTDDDEPDDDTDTGGTGDDDGPSDVDCGSRTATTVPPAGTLTQAITIDTQVSDPDSALAKVLSLGGLASCPGGIGGLPSLPSLQYELGANGQILSPDLFTDGRFIIDSGCLGLESETPDTPPPPPPPPGRCDPDQREITQTRIPGTGDFICVELVPGTNCIDCAQVGNVWTQSGNFTVTYRALGSLSDVSTLDPCTSEEVLVDIKVGDEVTSTTTIESRYESE